MHAALNRSYMTSYIPIRLTKGMLHILVIWWTHAMSDSIIAEKMYIWDIVVPWKVDIVFNAIKNV